MKPKCCTTFIKKLKATCQQSKRQSVAVFMVFWSDGFDPTTSMKRNRHSVWILTVTIFLVDVQTNELYLVESCLVSMGPGKGNSKSKEDYTFTFDRLR